MFLLVLSLTYTDKFQYGDYVYPSWSIVFGWCLNTAFVLPIPIMMIYGLLRNSGSKRSFKDRLVLLFVPTVIQTPDKQQDEHRNKPLLAPLDV